MRLSTRSSDIDWTPKGLVYLLFFVCMAAMVYGLITSHWLIFAGVALFPFAAIILIYVTEKPMLSYILLGFIICYFSAIYRYAHVEGLSVIVDIALGVSILSVLINVANYHESYPWKNAFNILTVTHFIWISYILICLLDPNIHVYELTTNRGVFLTTPLLYIISSILLYKFKQLKIALILLGLFVLTVAMKVYWQKTKGFDSAEINWLVNEGGWVTHLLRSGIRYFSFYSDAGNFGSGMGIFTITFGILTFIAQHKWSRLFCLGVTILASIGMIMSGTRGAMIVPFGGLALYCLLSKSIKMITTSIIAGGILFCFFYFTDIGDGNVFIRRMRTAFRPAEDASFNVRLSNQKRFEYYLKDKPFGLGVGGKVVDIDRLGESNDEKHIPPDSFYVNIWVESGIVGLSLYITLQVLVLLRCCYLIMFKIKNNQLRQILAALICGVFGIWLNGYVGRGMGMYPSSFIITIFIVFSLNGIYMDKKLDPNEIMI